MRVLWSKCLLAGLLVCANAHAQIDKLRGGTTSSTDFSTRYGLKSYTTSNLRFLSDPAGSGRPVLSARVRSSDAKVSGLWRTDIYPRDEYVKTGLRWYALSVYFPSNWVFHPNPVVVAQVDTTQSSTVALPPPLTIVARGGSLELGLNFNHRAVSGTDPATQSNSAHEDIRLDTLRLGQWYCFVLRAEWSPTLGTGAHTLWMNRDKVYESLRAYNAFQTTVGNVPRVGLMFTGLMGVSERTLYMDFIRLGGPTSYVEQMYAETPCATAAFK